MSLKLAYATLLSVVAATAAHAGTIIVTNGLASATVMATDAAGAAAPFQLLNLGNAGTNGLVSSAPASFTGGSIGFANTAAFPQSGVYDGTVANVAKSPYLTTNIPSANYLVAEPGGSVVIGYTAPQSVVNLLWGSLDSYDSLNLQFLSNGTSVGSITLTGSQIGTAAGISTGNSPDSAFVSITPGGSLSSFNSVIATATTAAFEFNIGLPSTPVPEPATLALLATGLVGFGLRRARRG